MKNIHLIPTDKPSRLHLGDSGLVLCDLNFGRNTINGQNIYITNDEEIKEGDKGWLLENNGITKNINQYDCTKGLGGIYPTDKKIILTTDDQLIQNGVQAVDDDFLEWFLNNSSCEKVETYSLGEENELTGESCHYKYEIIIPQAELKQSAMDKGSIDKFLDSLSDKELKEKWNKYEQCSEQENSATISEFIENIKQETVEEVAERMWNDPNKQLTSKNSFIQGAKFQAERMYSEEEVFSLIDKVFHMYASSYRQDAKEWFEQFKKKQQ
jgi:hypothetical protein